MGSPEGRLDRVRWKNRAPGEETERGVHNLSLFISAEPAADRLRDCSVTLDSNGFVKTGSDATAGPARSGHEVRAATAHQSSVAGVFAVGDVRSGSTSASAPQSGKERPSWRNCTRFSAAPEARRNGQSLCRTRPTAFVFAP
jgi:thioredoxin reductase (NADPH)